MFRKIHSGDLYNPGDADVMAIQLKCLDKLHEYNKLSPSECEKQAETLSGMFAEIGENCYITPPVLRHRCGKHIHFGKGTYCNFGWLLTAQYLLNLTGINTYIAFVISIISSRLRPVNRYAESLL